MSSTGSCRRAAELLRDLDAAEGATAPRASARDARDDVWLAEHLESCPHCSLADDPLANRLLAELARADELPDEDFFAAQHARIMQAIALEPVPAAAPSSGAAREIALGGAPGRAPAQRAPRRGAPRAAHRRGLVSHWRVGVAFALAASVALAVFVAERAPRPGASGEANTAMPAPAGVAAVERDVGDAGGEGDAIWLVASSDPLTTAGAPTLEELDDDELDDLARTLGAGQG